MRNYYCLALLLLLGLYSNAQSRGPINSLKFDGANSYVDCGTINLSNAEITMEAWIKVDTFKTATPYVSSILGTDETNSTAKLQLGGASNLPNQVQFVIRTNGTDHELTSADTITTDQWYHIAGTYDGDTMRLFINGIQQAIANVTGTVEANDQFNIGMNGSSSNIFNGQIEEAAVYSSAIDSSYIKYWMCQRIKSNHPFYSSLEGYWKMDDGSGTTLTDESTNGNNGTLIATPQWEVSTAPVGDQSLFSYGPNINVGLANSTFGDVVVANVTGGTAAGIHIYRVDTVPNYNTTPTGMNYIDSTMYWGIFTVGSGSYTVTYIQNPNSPYSGSLCNGSYVVRDNNADSTWNLWMPDSILLAAPLFIASSSAQQLEFAFGEAANGSHVLSFTETEPTCYGDSDGSLTVSASGGANPHNFVWSNGATTPTTSSLTAGTYYVTMTDNNSCTNVDSVVLGEPDSLVALANAYNTVCADSSTGAVSVVTTGGTTPYTLTWSNNSTGDSISGLDAQVYYFTVTDDNACTLTDSAEVEVAFPDPTPNLGPDQTACGGEELILTPTDNGMPYASYSWSSGSTTAEDTVTQSGSYAITVSNNGGCFGSDTIDVLFIAPMPVDLGADLSGPSPVTIDAGSGFNGYDWNTGETTQTIDVTQSGDYWVMTTDTNGCTDSDTIYVEVTVGVDDVIGSTIKVYPNPATDMIYFDLKDQAIEWSTLRVINVNGQEVNVNREANAVRVDGLANGIYWMLFQTQDSQLHQVKFQKQ